MKAAIVTIGDEILIGQITDTNSGFIAKELDKIGIQTHEMLSISDDKNHILSTFKLLQNKVDIVVITGGLGPTKDDITKKTFCDYFDDELVSDSKVLAHVTEIIEGFFKRKISQLNIDQALVPAKCTVLFNKVGTAPGMWIQKENTLFISYVSEDRNTATAAAVAIELLEITLLPLPIVSQIDLFQSFRRAVKCFYWL